MYSFFSDVSFSCKTHACSYAKRFITEQIPFDTIIELNSTNGKFLVKLLSYHPDASYKIGCGIKHFIKRVNNHRYILIIIRTDGSEESFSYKVCCGITFDDLTTAMRTAIAPFLAEYKKSNPSSCSFCKTIFGLQVDHKSIPFCIIKKKFLEQNTLAVPHKFAKNDFKTVCFESVDAVFEKAWTDYHNKIADYQILCGYCNSKKGDKIEINSDGKQINQKPLKNISSLYINLNDL